MKLLSITPSAIYPWKRRPVGGGFGGRMGYRESLSKERSAYVFQLTNLKRCLQDASHTASRSPQFHYLEVNLLIAPEEINAEYLEFISSAYNLDFVKSEPSLSGSKVFLYGESFSVFIENISNDLSQLEDYINENISKEEFTRKRIVLWQSFEISTNQTKDQVSDYLEESFEPDIEIKWMRQADNKKVEDISKACGVSVEVYNGGTIDISELRFIGENNPLSKISEFVNLISNYDEVEQISLDEYVCKIEDSEKGMVDEQSIQIKSLPEKAPVVAVLDTGVARNAFTAGALTPDGLDFSRSNQFDPNNGDPFKDDHGHGTSVACQIIYGARSIDQYFLAKEIDSLVPVVRIFPIKVFGSSGRGNIRYGDIFSDNSPLVDAIKKYDIKYINLSVGSLASKPHDSIALSKAAKILDAFAKKHNVLFTIASGNIEREDLTDLAERDPSLSFFNRNKQTLKTRRDFSKINIGSPADSLNSITVGSCYHQADGRLVVSSFSRSFHLSLPGYTQKPEVLAWGGGDYSIDLSTDSPRFNFSSCRACFITNDHHYLNFDNGTSFSSPLVARALAIGSLIYPDVPAQTIKNIFLHKISGSRSQVNARKYGTSGQNQKQQKSLKFHSSFCGIGSLSGQDEDMCFQDGDGEESIVIEGSIDDGKIYTYEIPIQEMLAKLNLPLKNKINLRMSVNSMASYDESLSKHSTPLTKANDFHIGAMVHYSDLNPTTVIEKTDGKGGVRVYRDQAISASSPEAGRILINWTSNYQGYLPNFAQGESKMLYEDFLDELKGGDTLKISVRGLRKDESVPDSKPFSLVFSMEDGGATVTTSAEVEINV